MSMKESLLLRRVNSKKNEEERSVALDRTVYGISSSIENYPRDKQLIVLKPIFVICDYVLSIIEEEEKRCKEKKDALLASTIALYQGDSTVEGYLSSLDAQKGIPEKYKEFDKEKEDAIASKTGENLPIEKIIEEHLTPEEKRVLNNFIKIIKEELEVKFGESFALITDEHPKILEEYVDKLKKDSKSIFESAVNNRKNMTTILQQIIEIIKKDAPSEFDEKSEEWASESYIHSSNYLIEVLTRLIANETLIKVAKEQIKKAAEKKDKKKR